MLNVSLAYIVQADREREVAEDLRSRQSLLPQRDSRAAAATTSRPVPARRSTARVGSTNA